MSINFGIYWMSTTEEYTKVIDSENPDEIWETGIRGNYKSFIDYNPDDPKFKLIYQKMKFPKLKFVSSDKFLGFLEGYVFQIGEKGLGYYMDPLLIRQIIYR